MLFSGLSIFDSLTVDTLQVAYVKRNGVLPEPPVLQPSVVIADKQRAKVGKRNVVLSQICGETTDVRTHLMRRIIPSLCLQPPHITPGVGYEANTIGHFC